MGSRWGTRIAPASPQLRMHPNPAPFPIRELRVIPRVGRLAAWKFTAKFKLMPPPPKSGRCSASGSTRSASGRARSGSRGPTLTRVRLKALQLGGRICRTRVPGFGEVRERLTGYDADAMELEYELVDPPWMLAGARNRLEVSAVDDWRSRVSWAATVDARGVLGHLLILPLRMRLRRVALRSMDDLSTYVTGTRKTKAHRVLTFSRRVAASPSIAWEVVSDVAAFGEHAPNLSRTEVLSGDEVGMTRRCFDSRGRGWTETCTLWEEGRRYGMRSTRGAIHSPYDRCSDPSRASGSLRPRGPGLTCR